MGKRNINNKILGDIPPASFDSMSAGEMRVLLREYQIELEKQKKKTASIKRENNDTILSKALIASTELIDENPDGINYQKMTDTVLELSGAQYACFNIFDENGLDFTTIALSGINENIQKVSSFLGFEVINKKWSPDPVRDKLTKNKVINQFKTLHELTGTIIPTPIVTLIINTFNLGEITLVKIDKNDKRIGDFTLIFAKGDTLQNPEIVEMFANQVGMFIDRKRVTDALRANEERNRTILSTAIEGFWIVDLQGKILEANDTYCQMSGYSIDELLKMRVFDIAITDTPDKTSNRIKSVIEQGNLHFESKHRRKDKTIFDAEINIQYRPDEEKIYTFIHDISDRKRAEEALQLQYRLQQLLVNTSTAYINLPLDKLEITIKKSLHDLAVFVGADRAYIFDYDYQHEICINIHEWCADGIDPQIDELQTVPFSELQEWVISHFAGKSICIPDVSSLPPGWGREILELQNIKSLITVPLMKDEECIGFVGFDSVRKKHIYTDNEQQLLTVFARMLVNIKMRQITENTLRENEQRTRVIFETLSEGIALNEIIYNDNGEMVDYRIIEVNDAFYKITGLTRDAEIIGNVATRLYSMDVKTIKDFWINHLNQKETIITEVFNPLVNRTFSVSTSPIENNRFVTSFQDITELKQIDDIRKESEQRLNRAEKVARVGNWKLMLNTGKMLSSDGARYIYGVEENEIPLDIIKKIALPEYREMLDKALTDLITNDIPYNVDFKIRRPNDGKIIDINSQAEYDRENNVLFGIVRDITRRKRLMDTLRSSEEKYRIITENSSDVIWHMDSNYCFDYISPADEKMRGFKQDEVLGHSVWSLLKPEGVEYVKQENTRRLADEAKGIKTGTIRYELEQICKNGSWVWTEVNSTAHHDANGKLIGLHGVTRDISERKLAEKALLTQQENLKAIFSSAPVGMLLINDEFIIVDSNKAFEQLMMRDSSQVINQRGGGGFGCIHSFEDERGCGFGIACQECQFRQILTQVLETGAIIHGDEIQHGVVINGEEHHLWLSINAEPVMINGYRHAIIAINDTTDRKKIEEALKISEENYRTIFNAATEAIFIDDAATGKMIDVNDAMLKLYGYSSKEEVLAGNIGSLSANIEPYTEEVAQNYIRKTITEGPQTFEWIARKKDGSIFWIEMTLKKTDIDGEGRIIAVGRDMTERKHTQELIEKRIVSLTQPLESDIEFDELFNIDEIQRIQDEFALATGVASIITHPDGTPITRPSNFTYLCSEIIRKTERGCTNCFKSDAYIGRYHPNGPVVQPCLSGGLFDAGACITVGGRHIANWLIGQVRNESQTEEKMRQYAKEIGADEEELLKAFDRVPGMSLKHFKLIANSLFTLANYLSTGAYQNVQQARFISERKKIEDTLRDSEFFFKESQRAASIGSYSTDFTTGYWKSSEVLDQIFGIDESYDRNVPGWLNIVHPDDREMMATYLTEEVIGKRKPFDKEYRITRIADGETRWIHGKGEVTFDTNGNILTLIGTIHDITEKQLAIEALRANEEKLLALFSVLPVGVSVLDKNSKIIEMNPELEKILGISPEDLKDGKYLNQTYLRSDCTIKPREEFASNIAIHENRTVMNEVTGIIKENGDVIWTSVNAVPLPNSGVVLATVDITERKRIEEELKESEYKYRSLIHYSSDPISSFNLDGTYRFVNEAFADLLGMTPEDITGKSPYMLFPPDEAEKRIAMVQQVIETCQKGDMEIEVVNTSGETLYLLTMFDPIINELGEILYITCVSKNITARKQIEESLRDSEARLSDIIFNTADWVWEVDSKGAYTYSSPQCFDILGITPEEIIGKTPLDFMPIDEATRIAVIFAEIVANKQPIREMENWNIGINGEKICLLTDGVPLFDKNGNLTGYRGVDKDITERKLAQEALQKSEARYRSILDASPDDITITDMQGRLVMVSPRGIAMFGYDSQEEGIGKLITDFIVPEDRERASANIAIKFKGVNTGHNEYVGIRADGSTFALESNSEFIYNSDGIPTNIVFVIRDITERKRTEAALIESERKFRNLVWDMHVGVLLQGPDAEILMSNPKALELLGISEDQLLGKTSFDPNWNVIHEDGSPFPEDTHPVPTAIATRTPVNNVVMGVYRPDTGDRVWLLVDAEPEINDDDTVKQVVCSFIDITELKNAEAAMQVSEERFRAISEYSHSAICIVDENAKILWINEKMVEISRFNREQIMAAESFISFIAPESADFVVSNFMEFVAGHEYHHHYNFYIIRADGEHRLLEKHMTHYTDKQGRRSLIISMLDVTETERAAKALIESEEKFSIAFKASPEAISIIALKDGTYIDVNDIFLKISGFKKEDVIGKTALELNFWIDINERVEYQNRLLRDGFIRNFEAQFKMRFGEIRNFIVSSEVIELDGEKCSLNFIVDITERKKAEEALRENEAKQGKMVANIGDVIVIIDKNGINQYKSPNIERWFGWTPEDVIGKPALDNVHPDDVDAAGKFITFIMTTPDSTGTTQCRYRCKDGRYKWIEFTGFNLMNDPDIQGLLGNYQDISERKRAEEEKDKLEAQLQHALKMESVGRLAGGVAHDFNNMLQAILGNADMAIEMAPPDSPLRESLDEICNAAERSADLTRQLLAFARKQTVAPKVLNLNETVDGMIKMLHRLIGENIDLCWLPGDGLWSTKVDPSQIDQILANLCVNARDAINGVGKITIETENCFCDEGYCANHIGFEPGSYVHLTVSDNGCGMDKEMMEHIFEPFFTTKGIGEGTGLGLATVYGAVKQNNGYIITYSEVGKGTSFNIYLPRYIGKSEQLAKDGKDGVITQGKETILLCEDEATILKLAKMMLQRIGYNVLAANTPGEAVQLAEDYDGDIQVLMTDVIMPEMNGRDLARRIQQIYPNIKRLFMSGYTADVIAHHGILEEGVHFLQKPFSMKELSARVRETVEE